MTPEREAEIRERLDATPYTIANAWLVGTVNELFTAMQAERNRADAAEQVLDRVWTALGITTVPVGMTAAAEVEKLKERIATLEAAIKAATEAVAPFRNLVVPPTAPDFVALVLATIDGGIVDSSQRVTVGDLRRLKALPTPPAGGAHG